MKKRILVVDDDPGIRDIFKIIFEKAGYEIEVKENGHDILSQKYIMPDLFLIDKHMTGVDGLEICRYLKIQPATRHIPVIIVSATPDLGSSAKKAGADDFIEKPIDLNDLLQFVADHLDRGKLLHKI